MFICAVAGSWCITQNYNAVFHQGKQHPPPFFLRYMYISKHINVWNIVFLQCSSSCFIDLRIFTRSVKSCSCQGPQEKSHSLQWDQDCLPFPKHRATVHSAAAPSCGVLCASSSAFPSPLQFPQCLPSGSQPVPRSLP